MPQPPQTLPIGISFQPAEPAQDFEYAYDLFRRTTNSYVEELAGEWPDRGQRDFFWKGFNNPDSRMILHEGKPVGSFCITEAAQTVELQRMYIEPEFQNRGIGRQILALALEKAHRLRKPLQLEVLKNNEPAIAAYARWGFVISAEASYKWVQAYEMRHRDTLSYAPGLTSSPPRPF